MQTEEHPIAAWEQVKVLEAEIKRLKGKLHALGDSNFKSFAMLLDARGALEKIVGPIRRFISSDFRWCRLYIERKRQSEEGSLNRTLADSMEAICEHLEAETVDPECFEHGEHPLSSDDPARYCSCKPLGGLKAEKTHSVGANAVPTPSLEDRIRAVLGKCFEFKYNAYWVPYGSFNKLMADIMAAVGRQEAQVCGDEMLRRYAQPALENRAEEIVAILRKYSHWHQGFDYSSGNKAGSQYVDESQWAKVAVDILTLIEV